MKSLSEVLLSLVISFTLSKREISVAVLPVVGQDAMKLAGDNDTSTAVARRNDGKMYTHV